MSLAFYLTEQKGSAEDVPVLLSLGLYQIIQICQEMAFFCHGHYISRSYGRIELGKGAYSSLTVLLIQSGK